MHKHLTTRVLSWLLQLAVANSPDSLLQGYQGGSGSQLLPQDQGSQVQVRGPRGYRNISWQGRHCWCSSRRLHPRHPAARGCCNSSWLGGASTGSSTTSSPAPSPGGKGTASKRGAGGGRKNARLQGRCRLNKCAWTWIGATPGSSQSQPTGQPAGQIKKLQPKGYNSVSTHFNYVCTFHEMYVAICTLNISYTNPACVGWYLV